MFTPAFIRENTTRLGRGTVVENSGEEHDDVELFSGSDTSMIVAIKQFAAIQESERREIVIVFPVANCRRFEINSQE
jgi:hypothetical protein